MPTAPFIYLRRDGANANSNIDINGYDYIGDLLSGNCLITNTISTNRINFIDNNAYVYASSQGYLKVAGDNLVIVGIPGNIILGDDNLRIMYPQTDKCIDLGTPTNQFNTIYCDTLINDDYYPSSLGRNLYNFSSNSKYLYAGSSNTRTRFPGSGNVNRELINLISSTAVSRFYPSTSGRDYAYKHSANTGIHALSTTNIRIASVSSSRISGQWISPLYTNLTGAGNASTRPGQIIRTSGNADGTWIWISIFGGSTYQWKELANLSGV